MKILPNIALCLLVLSSSAACFAKEISGYEVELIIFENANGRYLNSEDWSYNDTLHQIKEGVFHNDTSTDEEYKELPWSSAKLAKNLEHLLQNKNYKVLVNKRWKQTGLDRKETLSVPVGKIINEISKSGSGIAEDIIGNINPESGIDSYVTGDVQLIMSRYLHFDVNLKYFKPMLNSRAEYEFQSFPIVLERRMKSREVHYMDHPLVGVVVLATPYKIKVDDTDS